MKTGLSWFARAASMALGLAMMLSAVAAPAQAGGGLPTPPGAPEIDPGSMGSALTLLIGGMLLLTGKSRKS